MRNLNFSTVLLIFAFVLGFILALFKVPILQKSSPFVWLGLGSVSFIVIFLAKVKIIPEGSIWCRSIKSTFLLGLASISWGLKDLWGGNITQTISFLWELITLIIFIIALKIDNNCLKKKG